MKANELMIGDWVQCTYWHNPHILQVYELKRVSNDELKIVVVEDALPLVFQEMYIEPIPLTAEVLEKNGWKYNPDIKAYEWQDKAFYISIIMDGKTRIYVGNDYIFGMALGAVHELQHALRLCGIDKEMVLND